MDVASGWLSALTANPPGAIVHVFGCTGLSRSPPVGFQLTELVPLSDIVTHDEVHVAALASPSHASVNGESCPSTKKAFAD
jgi:hypothetical protein